MKAIFRILLCVIFMPSVVNAQNQVNLTNAPSIEVKDYLVSPTASAGPFNTDSLRVSTSDNYWLKIAIYNPYPNDEHYLLSLSEPLNYVLYSKALGPGKWKRENGGLNARKRQRHLDVIPVILKPEARNIFYLKIDLRDLKQFGYAGKPSILLQKEVTFNAEERFTTLFFYICCIALISFSCYNFYIYFQLKDKAYLYYVIVQIGALIFFIGDNYYMNVLSGLRIHHIIWPEQGQIEYYALNDFAEHIGVAIIFWGFIQFTRTYLGVKATLPFLDRLLNMLAYTYVLLEAVPALVTITGIYYLNMAIIDNIFILIIIITCMITAMVASFQHVKVAKHFLLANLPPAIFAIGASSHILLFKESSTILPTLAILSQIFTFAVALVARIKFINNDLNRKAEEAMQMKMEMTSAAYEALLIGQQNMHMKLTMELEQKKNELLQQKLEANQRELVGNSLQIHQKNKILSNLNLQLKDVDPLNPLAKSEIIRNIKSSLKDNQYLDEKWDDFKLHFEQVHPSFFDNLVIAHPNMTTYELRLYAYFHINLSTKEIAALLNIAPASVRQAKTRLLKKMREV